jgi:hypothetical protein
VKQAKSIELAVVVRVGRDRVPVIIGSVRDEVMLRQVIQRAIVAAERQAGYGHSDWVGEIASRRPTRLM